MRCDSPADHDDFDAPVTEPTAIDALYARADDLSQYQLDAKSEGEARYWGDKLEELWAKIRACVPIPDREARKPR
jgi:hypothetical protein